MISLIKGEIKKIFKKKSFYIVTIIFGLYCLLTNVLYKNINNLLIMDFSELSVAYLEEENKTLDLDNQDDRLQYVENLNAIEIEKLKKECNNKSASYLLDNFLYDLINEANVYKYLTDDEDTYTLLREEIDEHIKRIKEGDWKYYTNLKINNLKQEIDNEYLESDKEKYRVLIEAEEYRLDNNIEYDEDNYLHKALEDVEVNYIEYANLKEKSNLSEIEETRLKQLDEALLKDKYALENKKDINSNDTLNALLQNFTDEFGLFILIYVIMISGSIVSEEFNKGTIKLLLTKPYKRRTILLAKLLTILLLIPLIVLMMVIIELIMGSIILGVKSLTIPVMIYKAGELIKHNIFGYLFLNILASLPIYIVLGVLCFMLSCVTSSTSAAITITFLFYLASNVASSMALIYNIKFLKYFVSLNWDFRYLVNAQSNPYDLTGGFSSIIVLVYLVIMVSIAFVNFQKKDVKNI